MTIESKRATVVRLAAAAGLGQFLPPELGLPGTWWGTDLDALERFFDGAAKEIVTMREIELISQKVDVLAAVAAEREACAAECEARHANGNRKHTHPDDCADAIRARGKA